jgi:uncharacterized DUF497 family protein
VRISFDPVKNERNLVERGLSFERVGELDWLTAIAIEDTRHNYGERRIRVLASLEGRLHAAVVTVRSDSLHVISFRKANPREVKGYEKQRR